MLGGATCLAMPNNKKLIKVETDRSYVARILADIAKQRRSKKPVQPTSEVERARMVWVNVYHVKAYDVHIPAHKRGGFYRRKAR